MVPLPVLPLLLRSPIDPPLVVITVGQTAPAGSPKRLTALASVSRKRDRTVWRRYGRVLHLAVWALTMDIRPQAAARKKMGNCMSVGEGVGGMSEGGGD